MCDQPVHEHEVAYQERRITPRGPVVLGICECGACAVLQKPYGLGDFYPSPEEAVAQMAISPRARLRQMYTVSEVKILCQAEGIPVTLVEELFHHRNTKYFPHLWKDLAKAYDLPRIDHIIQDDWFASPFHDPDAEGEDITRWAQ